MSGYLFLVNNASNSCSCCEVKCVLCRRPLLLLSPESFVELLLPLFPLEPFVTIAGSVNWLSGLSELWLGDSFWVISKNSIFESLLALLTLLIIHYQLSHWVRYYLNFFTWFDLDGRRRKKWAGNILRWIIWFFANLTSNKIWVLLVCRRRSSWK